MPSKSQRKEYGYTLWFNNFVDRFESGQADWYFLFGLYPVYSIEENIKSRERFWRSVILAFSDEEMKSLLDQVKTKEGKKGRFFYIVFNTLSEIYGTRLGPERRELTHHLLSSRKTDLKKALR